MGFGVQVNMQPLERLPKAVQQVVDEAVDKTAREVAGIAEDLAERRTGSMAEGVYYTSPFGSDYAESASAARAVNPRVDIIPEAAPPGPGGAVVGAAAGHSVFREPASPFLAPAAQQGEQLFVENLIEAALERIEELGI